MPYWVYGKDAATGQPSEPFFCNAESEEAARQQASAEGILVEEVEHVEGAPEQDDSGAPQTDSAAAQADRGTPAAELPRWISRGWTAAGQRGRGGMATSIGRGVSRGVIWLIGGCFLIAVSYMLAYAMNDYVMEGSVQQAFGRAQRLSGLASFIKLTRYAGMVAAAAGGIMWIVDTSPNRPAP
jgi:hypothetical protein